MSNRPENRRIGISLEGILGIAATVIVGVIFGIAPLLTKPWDFLKRALTAIAAAGCLAVAFLIIRAWAARRRSASPARTSEQFTGLHIDYVPPKPEKVISGRGDELRAIRAFLYGERFGTGTGGLYWLIGQRGVGKTAILNEIAWELRGQPDAQYVFRGRCKEGGEQSPFFAVQMALTEFFADGKNADVMEILRGVAPRWIALANLAATAEGQEWLKRDPILPQTSPIPELSAFIDRLLEKRPVILIVDDAHWLDNETASLLRLLFHGTARAKLCCIAAARPEGMDENKTLARLYADLKSGIHGESATLSPLNERAVRAMLGQLLGEGPIIDQLAPVVTEMTGGIPLAVENGVAEIKKLGMIQEDGRSGGWRLCADVSQIREVLGRGLESLVESSFADLDVEEQSLLLAASTQGAEFDSCVAAQAAGLSSGEGETVLLHLSANQQFIDFLGEEQTSGRDPSMRFRFHHWLYQDCVRRRLTPSRKQEVSGKVAAAIEMEFPDSAVRRSGDLAELYSVARNEAKEREYRVHAARQQLSLSAYASAIRSAKRASFLFEKDKVGRDAAAYRDVMVILGVCQTALNGYANQEAQEAYRKSMEIAKEANLPEHFPSRYGVWMYHLVRGKMADAQRLAAEMLDLALRDDRLAPDRSQARWAMGVTQYFMGDVPSAKLNFEAGIQIYREEWHDYYASSYVLDPGVANRYLLARAHVFLGCPDQARSTIRESLELARKLNHIESLAFALVSAGVVHAFYGAVSEVQRCAAELTGISAGNELRQHRPWAHILQGWASGMEGDLDLGMQELLDGLDRYEKMGARLALAGFYAMEADLRRRQGLFDQEERVIRKATEHMVETGQRYYWPEFLRLGIQNLRNQGRIDPRQSIIRLEETRLAAIAMQARAAELRVVTDLAVAQDLAGDPATACLTIGDFLAGYPEGRDTPDLQRAENALADFQSKCSKA